MLWSRGPHLYRGTHPDETPAHVATVSLPAARSLVGTWRLGERLLRQSYYNAVPLADGTIFYTFGTDVGVVRDGRASRLPGRARPSRVLRGGCAVAADGSVYFGEYRDNTERGAVSVYRYRPGDDAITVAHTFPAGSVRHVHSVRFDAWAGELVVATGDRPSECRILRTRDGFATLDTVGGGNERWRCVQPQFTPGSMVFGTDAQFTTNGLFRVARDTGVVEELAAVDGPIFYGTTVGDDVLLATAVEGSPSQEGDVAVVWCVDPSGHASEVARFRKDRWPKRWFQFGIVNFPAGPGLPDRTFVSGVGLKGLDGRLHELRRAGP